MSPKQENTTLEQLDLFAEDSLAKTYRLPENARDFLESDQDFGSSSIEFLRSLGRDGLLSRTSPACYPASLALSRRVIWKKDKNGKLQKKVISESSFEGWQNSGMASLGGCLTLSITEWPSDAAVCSLSEVLETDVPQKYYLSPRAARGILRRAEKRGRELPTTLYHALVQVANSE
jgi:hypothetical protein